MRNGGCASGAEALAALREAHASGDPFQIAVVDLNTPEMDDEMLGRAVKSDPDLQDTVLVLLTSFRQPGDAGRRAEAGFVAYMTKPVRPSALMDAMATAWSGGRLRREALRISRRAAAEHTLPTAPADAGDASSGIRVLVVEDKIVNQRVAGLLLQRIGCRIDVAANGKEAVEMVQRIPYDIVFMDCQMPVMDGYEATREIRRLEKPGEHLAIVAMTAHAMQGDRDKCLEMGMDDYVTKPVQRETLESAVRKWVPQVRAPLAEVVVEPELHKTLQWMREQGGDEFVDDLVTDFLKASRDEISDLGRALASGEVAMVKSIAHGLKGGSATLGAARLAQACGDLESKISSGALEAITLEELRQQFERIEVVLTRFVAREGKRERQSGISCDPPLAERETSKPGGGSTLTSGFDRG